MRKMFTVTYTTVTPESAGQGDYADYGYVLPSGCTMSCADCQAELGDAWRENWPPVFALMTLQEARRLCDPNEDSGRWFSESDGRDNYQTGENETRSLHPPEGITASSYARLRRVLLT